VHSDFPNALYYEVYEEEEEERKMESEMRRE
jgi:hypothetical protein